MAGGTEPPHKRRPVLFPTRLALRPLLLHPVSYVFRQRYVARLRSLPCGELGQRGVDRRSCAISVRRFLISESRVAGDGEFHDVAYGQPLLLRVYAPILELPSVVATREASRRRSSARFGSW